MEFVATAGLSHNPWWDALWHVLIVTIMVSPLADVLTKSYLLLIAKSGVIVAGVLLHDNVVGIWFVSALAGLAVVSLGRGIQWFRKPPPNNG